ncbi:MAG: hypothetical protein ACI8S6_002662, partial [Myxococcota bacterium]
MEDVPLLISHFLSQTRTRYNLPPMRLSESALETLLDHSWPGNVRELANTLDRAALLSSDGVIETVSIRSRRRGGARPSGVIGALEHAGFADPRSCKGTVYTTWPTTAIPSIDDSASFTQQVSWPIGMSWVPVLQSPPSCQSPQNGHITGCWGKSGPNPPSLDANGQGFAMQFTWKKTASNLGCVVRMDTYATSPNGEPI